MSLLLDALKRVEGNPSGSWLAPSSQPATVPPRDSSFRPLVQIRQLAANVLAALPNDGPLRLAFVTLPSSCEWPRLLSGLAAALRESLECEVLLLSDVGEFACERSWQTWKRRYRFVIVPSEGKPGELALLSGADGVFLAVALGKVRRRSVNDCVARLQASGVPIRGGVLIGP
ncbi:MAG TPA: hypothetical protein VMV69_00190 [Pirellulales bacterium]|nr:hypothetical protein [Pirellulales bacterium]